MEAEVEPVVSVEVVLLIWPLAEVLPLCAVVVSVVLLVEDGFVVEVPLVLAVVFAPVAEVLPV